MIYPALDINLKTIRENVKSINLLCKAHNIVITGVTKVFSGDPSIVKAYIDGGLERVGDARIENLKRIKDFDIEKWLIRVPSNSEVEDVVTYSNVSMNSELDTILRLNSEAKRQNLIHKVILMIDLGDLREGYTSSSELLKVANIVKELSNIELYGIATNLTCFSFILPDKEKMDFLVNLSKELPISNPIISGGNSATIKLMMENQIPGNINSMRLGESLLFGKERRDYTFLDNTRRDAFILSAEVVEIKKKPSVPWGTTGCDSYGNRPETPEDQGIIERAIVAIGKQDCDVDTMTPVNSELEILGASSDYLILNVSNSHEKYHVGSIIQFQLGYYSLMRAITSSFVAKNYV